MKNIISERNLNTPGSNVLAKSNIAYHIAILVDIF